MLVLITCRSCFGELQIGPSFELGSPRTLGLVKRETQQARLSPAQDDDSIASPVLFSMHPSVLN